MSMELSTFKTAFGYKKECLQRFVFSEVEKTFGEKYVFNAVCLN